MWRDCPEVEAEQPRLDTSRVELVHLLQWRFPQPHSFTKVCLFFFFPCALQSSFLQLRSPSFSLPLPSFSPLRAPLSLAYNNFINYSWLTEKMGNPTRKESATAKMDGPLLAPFCIWLNSTTLFSDQALQDIQFPLQLDQCFLSPPTGRFQSCSECTSLQSSLRRPCETANC